MNGKKMLCTGCSYRGVTIIEINVQDERRFVVVGARANLYECASLNEAKTLIDAALLIEGVGEMVGHAVSFSSI
jgi:hypothetical protein